MKRGMFLSAGWALVWVLVLPGTNRGVPLANCSSCDCTEGVLAWQFTKYVDGKPNPPNAPQVLKSWDATMKVYGPAVATAKWKDSFGNVYATNCLKNMNTAGNQYTLLNYSENWAPICTQAPDQTFNNYRPVTYDPMSTKFAPLAGQFSA